MSDENDIKFDSSSEFQFCHRRRTRRPISSPGPKPRVTAASNSTVPVTDKSLPNLERPQHVRPHHAGLPHRHAPRGLTSSSRGVPLRHIALEFKRSLLVLAERTKANTSPESPSDGLAYVIVFDL